MAANILFISEQYIKDTSYIDVNVDMKLLRSSILETQDIRVPYMVGTALYNELKTQINAGTLTNLNKTLLDTYISPCLKYWVLHDGSYILQYKIMNKGIVTRTSENTQTIQVSELDRLMDFFKTRAEEFQEKITKYLIEKNSSYPLYYNSGNGVDDVHPSQTNYTQGWYLGDSDKDYCYRKYS